MQTTENNPKIIADVNYLLTEEDFVSSTDIYINRLTSRKRLLSRSTSIALMIAGSASLFILFAFALYMSRGTDDSFPGIILAVAILYSAISAFSILSPKIIKKRMEKDLAQKRAENAFDVPTLVRFYSGGVEICSINSRSISPYDAFARVFECQEGLFLVHFNGTIYFLPARYFDSQSADKITAHLFEKFGMRYTRESVMQTSENAEFAGQTLMPEDESEKSKFSLDFELDIKFLADTARSINFKKTLIAEICLIAAAVVLFIIPIKALWLSTFFWHCKSCGFDCGGGAVIHVDRNWQKSSAYYRKIFSAILP